MVWDVTGVTATADRFDLTVMVTSLDMIADPQVGVVVQTRYHMPVPNPAPVGVYVCALAPVISVMAPPETLHFPHWRAVMAPPPVSVAVNCVPEAVTQIVCAVTGESSTAERLG